MSTLVKEILLSDLNFDRKVELLNLDREFQPPLRKYDEVLVSNVNKLLNAAKTRPNAFLLINESIDYFSEDSLAIYASTWLTSCLNYAQTGKINIESTYICMINLLVRCNDISAARKKVSINNLSHVVEFACRSHNPNIFTYKLLLTCVELYPSSCGQRRDFIKSFILGNLLTTDNASRAVLANIFANLYSVSSFGKSNPAKQAWSEQLQTLIVTIDELLELYRSQEISFLDTSISSQLISPLFLLDKTSINNINSTDCFNALMNIEIQFEFTCAALCYMIVNTKLDSLELPVQAVLMQIAKVCSVSLVDIYKRNAVLGCIVLALHLHVLSVLETLIKTCTTSLSIHSRFIMNLFTRILEKSKLPDFASRLPQFRSLNRLKARCYELIELWFNLLGPNVAVHSKAVDSLLKNMLEDISPTEAVVQLRDAKARKLDTSEEESTNHGKDESFSLLTHQSLRALKSLVTSNILLMSDTNKQLVNTFVLEESLSYLRLPVSKQRIEYRPAYKRDLLSLVLIMALRCPVLSTTTAIQIFNEALKSATDPAFKSYCNESLVSLNCLVNPTRNVKVSEN